MQSDRYAYDVAEQLLDAYGYHPGRTAQFKRAYRHLKWVIYGCVKIDYGVKSAPEPVVLSYVWEDVHMAFIGHGSFLLTGIVMDLWSSLKQGQANEWERVLYSAFRQAEEQTSPQVQRRYLPRWRRKPIRRLEEGFNLPTVLPIVGPKLKDWAEDNKQNYADLVEEMAYCERVDCLVNPEKEDNTEVSKGKRHILQLKDE